MKHNKGLWMQGDTEILCLPDGGQQGCSYFEPAEGRLGKTCQCKFCDIVTYVCNSKDVAVDLKSEEILDDI